jgi:crotonobetaine/carnitine-CoA ligase
MVTIVCKDGATLAPEELVRFCDSRMMYFMVPRFIEFADELPKTMSQKIEKYKLKQIAEARLSEIWDRERSGIKLTR